eukprot:3638664-Pleurochrysis_carterae.AAC.1
MEAEAMVAESLVEAAWEVEETGMVDLAQGCRVVATEGLEAVLAVGVAAEKTEESKVAAAAEALEAAEASTLLEVLVGAEVEGLVVETPEAATMAAAAAAGEAMETDMACHSREVRRWRLFPYAGHGLMPHQR